MAVETTHGVMRWQDHSRTGLQEIQCTRPTLQENPNCKQSLALQVDKLQAVADRVAEQEKATQEHTHRIPNTALRCSGRDC